MARILVVEHEAPVRAALASLLRRHGHELFEAASAAAARTGPGWSSVEVILASLFASPEPGTVLVSSEGPPVVLMTVPEAPPARLPMR